MRLSTNFLIVLAGEDEEVVGDAARLEVADVDGSPEEGYLDAQAYGLKLGLGDECPHFLDGSLCLFLLLQGDEQPFGVFGDAVVEVVEAELEASAVLVLLVAVGMVNLHGLALAVAHVGGGAVVPCVDLLVDKLLLLSLHPDGAVGFVDADDVDVVGECRALLAEHFVVDLIEDAPCLSGVGRFVLCLCCSAL